MGLGAVWVGVHPDGGRVAGMRRLLDLPETIVPLALIPMGWTEQPGKKLDRFDPQRIHKNRW
jgi:hypothetical protein